MREAIVSDDEQIDETHALLLPDVPIVMPTVALPVVRDGTIGGIPAYEADPPKEAPKKTPAQKKAPAKKKKGRR